MTIDRRDIYQVADEDFLRDVMSRCINQDAAMGEPRIVANERLVDEELQQATRAQCQRLKSTMSTSEEHNVNV